MSLMARHWITIFFGFVTSTSQFRYRVIGLFIWFGLKLWTAFQNVAPSSSGLWNNKRGRDFYYIISVLVWICFYNVSFTTSLHCVAKNISDWEMESRALLISSTFRQLSHKKPLISWRWEEKEKMVLHQNKNKNCDNQQ
jgi:hypothetical protein